MASLRHEYPVTAHWSGGRDGEGQLVPQISGKAFPIKVAPEFGGPGGETNPEELLTEAVVGCYSITLGIVAKNRRLPVVSIQVEAIGQVTQEGVNYTFDGIVLRPTIVLEAQATDEQVVMAEQTAHKAEKYCIITNAVRSNVTVTIEPTVRRA